MLIGRQQAHLIGDGLFDEPIEGCPIGLFNHLADYVALSADKRR
jgi:hypothetical protein